MLPLAVPPQPAPVPAPALPVALRRAWAQALGEAHRKGLQPRLPEGLPKAEAWPEAHPQRWVVAGLQAAGRGRAGERVWAESVMALHRGLRFLPPDPARVERLEALADLLTAQGLPVTAYRDEALRLRIEVGQGADPALEAAALEALKDHWGGWLEPPRRDPTLAWAERLAGLWARRPATDLAEAMAPAFQAHAPKLWDFVGRNGPPRLREQLGDLLGALDAGALLGRLGVRPLADWMGPLREGPWAEAVASLWSRLQTLDRERLSLRDRLTLAQAAGEEEAVRECLREGLASADERLRRTCLETLIRTPHAELLEMAEAQILALPPDDPLVKAWATERPKAPGTAPERVEPENLGWPALDAERRKAWDQALEDLEEGRRGPLEAFLIQERVEALRAPEAPSPDLLEALLFGLVGDALRERDWEGALAHLAALEPLRRRLRPPSPKVEGQVAELQRVAERSARLMALLGPAGEP